MPLYEYRDKRTGEIVELLRTVEDRDQVPNHLERLKVPARVGAVRGLMSDQGAAYKVPKALAEIESAQGSRCGAREIARHFGMPIDRIKRVWGMALFLMFTSVFMVAPCQGQELTRGITLQDGSRVSAAQLHALVDEATINGIFYTGQPIETVLQPSDYFLIWSSVANSFLKVTANAAVLANTNLISTQIEFTGNNGSGTNQFLLLYDANQATYYKVNETNELNWILGITNLYAPTTNTVMLSYDNGQWYRTTNGAWLNPTNFLPLLNPTNDFAFTLVDLRTNGSGTPYKGTLASVVTNAFPLSTTNLLSIPCVGVVTNTSSTNFVYGKLRRQSFVSTNFPSGYPTTQTNMNFAHGLPGTPQILRPVLVCLSSELGYSVGDEVPANYAVVSGFPNICASANTTNINLTFLNSGNLQIPGLTFPQTYTTYSTNKWAVRIYATWESQ